MILGGADHPSLNRDVVTLLTAAQSGFREVQLTASGTEYASYSTEWGDASDVVATTNASIVVWADTPITLLVEARPITLERAGAAVGSLHFSAGTQSVEVPLELESEIDDPGAWWRLTHPAQLF